MKAFNISVITITLKLALLVVINHMVTLEVLIDHLDLPGHLGMRTQETKENQKEDPQPMQIFLQERVQDKSRGIPIMKEVTHSHMNIRNQLMFNR